MQQLMRYVTRDPPPLTGNITKLSPIAFQGFFCDFLLSLFLIILRCLLMYSSPGAAAET